MAHDKEIRRQLLALLHGSNAHMNFDEVVDEFPMEHINRKASNDPYSPWHILEHMRIAQWDILEFIRNPNHISPTWPEEYFPAPKEKADESRWLQTLHDFRGDLRALEELAADPGIELFAPIPHAREYTIFREILLVADHNAYHIGEVAVLRQILDIWPSDKRLYDAE